MMDFVVCRIKRLKTTFDANSPLAHQQIFLKEETSPLRAANILIEETSSKDSDWQERVFSS
jgi:hypothetical protein